MFRRILATVPSWSTIPIRLALGAVMLAHGSQKVLGIFGGPGFKAFISVDTPFPFMRPPWLWLAAAALSEFLGGILVILGLCTRVAAFVIACTMATAVFGVLWPNFFSSNKGFEFPMVLLAMALSLLISGGGAASVDLMFSGRRRRLFRA
jgi:putative oxidoreductase